MKAKGFDKLLELVPEDEVTRVFSDGVTPDNVNDWFDTGYINNIHRYQSTLLGLATSLCKVTLEYMCTGVRVVDWNEPDNLEIIRRLLTMGAEVTPELLAHVNTQKQLRVILDFGVDPIVLDRAVLQLYYQKHWTTYIRNVKDLVKYGSVPKDLDFISGASLKKKTRIFIEKVARRVNNCRSALLTLILCIHHKYKPLKWLIQQLAKQIWSMHPFCSDLETPSAGPRSEVWDWDEKNQAPSKKRKQSIK